MCSVTVPVDNMSEGQGQLSTLPCVGKVCGDRYVYYTYTSVIIVISLKSMRGCCGRDRMVVGFITTYAISAYHH
jgi:hypothetical protein